MAENKKKSDLSNLIGISDARDEYYDDLKNGRITEARAAAMERALRGQTALKIEIPLRAFNSLSKAKNSGVQKYGEALMKRIFQFTTGEDPELLEAKPTEEE